jgi:RIO-like serine/threonine protein kinase
MSVENIVTQHVTFFNISIILILFAINLDDGYRLTNLGYDFLALKTFVKKNVLHSFGNQIARVKKLMSMWWAMKNKNGCA